MIPAPLAALALRVAPWAAGAAIVVAAYHFTPIIGPHARLEQLEENRDSWRTAAVAWERSAGSWQASFRKAERLRATEARSAITSVNAVQTQCDLRVKQARASAQAVKEIAHAPVKIDPAGCPVRGVVDAGRLRDALQAPAGH